MTTRVLLIRFLFLTLVIASCLSATGQNEATAIVGIPAPNEEKFVEGADLVIPWRDSSCESIVHNAPRNDCREIVRGQANFDYPRMELYNADGSLWYRFSLRYEDADNLQSTVKEGFKPMHSAGPSGPGYYVYLRLLGVSPNWFEVEVNEETREKKYAPRGGIMWDSTSWDFVHRNSRGVFIDPEMSDIYDKPNGAVIKKRGHHGLRWGWARSTDGEWLNVYAGAGAGAGRIDGWVKWRDGRKLLVGCIFNDYRVPEN